MNNKPKRSLLRRTALVAGVAVGWTCQLDLGPEPGVAADFDRQQLLHDVAHNVVGPTFVEFARVAGELQAATAAYAANSTDDGLRMAAREAWIAAMDVWQRAEVMQLGPAGTSLTAIGGLDLRDEIYSWPTASSCRVDQELVESSYAAPDFFDTSLVNVYGLDAIEYLLFNGSPDNSCPQQVPINDGAWDALGETEVTRRRADYAAVAATQVAAVAQTLAQQWDPAGGQYATWFAEPGAGGSPYESEAQALNELMRAMFYVDLRLKDEKLGRPGGIVDCGADVCIDALESQWADRSKEHAVANLRGLKQMFVAGDDPQVAVGFDDFLRAAGEEGLATEIVADIDAAIAALEAMPNSFADALASDGAALDNPHAAVKLVTDTLKGPFAMLLQLRIPDEGAGDAD